MGWNDESQNGRPTASPSVGKLEITGDTEKGEMTPLLVDDAPTTTIPTTP